MAQFVRDDVFLQFGRKHQKTPIQLDPLLRVAAAPPRLEIADRHVLGIQPGAARKRGRLFDQQKRARLYEKRLRAPHVFQTDRAAFFRISRSAADQRAFLPVEQDRLPLPNRGKTLRAPLVSRKLLPYPPRVFRNEGVDLFRRHGRRRAHFQNSVPNDERYRSSAAPNERIPKFIQNRFLP